LGEFNEVLALASFHRSIVIMGSSQSRPSSPRTSNGRRLNPLRRLSTLGRRSKRTRHDSRPLKRPRIGEEEDNLDQDLEVGRPDRGGTEDGIEESWDFQDMASVAAPVLSNDGATLAPPLPLPSIPAPAPTMSNVDTASTPQVISKDPIANTENPTPESETTISRSIPTSPAPAVTYPVRRPSTPINSPQPYGPGQTNAIARHRSSPLPDRHREGRRLNIFMPNWHTSQNVRRRRSSSVLEDGLGLTSRSTGVSATTAPSILPNTTVASATSAGPPVFNETTPLPTTIDPNLPHPLHRTRSEPAFGNTLIVPPPLTPQEQVRRLRVEGGFLGEEVALLREQLEVARREMEQAQVNAEAVEEDLRGLEDEATRLPGAVMMIQGIAQTHIPISTSRGQRLLGRFRGRGRERERERVPFEEQATTITGLILYVPHHTFECKLIHRVASLATANTLLSTERPRPRPNTMLETLMRRIHPSRAFAVNSLLADPSISIPNNGSTTAGEGDNLNMPRELMEWLESLQTSIRESMREYVQGTTLPLSRTTSVQPPVVERPDPGRRISAPVFPPPTGLGDPPSETPQSPSNPDGPSSDSTGEAPQSGSTLQVPQFHHQAGQTSTTPQSRTGVTTDLNGVRRLNFFRAHIFASPGNEDPNAIVPCLFVGVRSTTQDPATFGETVGHPFSDPTPTPTPAQTGEREVSQAVRPAMTRIESQTGVEGVVSPPSGIPSSPNGGSEQESRPGISRTQTLRSRLLALSPFSRHQPSSDQPQVQESERRANRLMEDIAQTTQPEPEPQATFIMYVIGGNFPRNHPVLRIPGLLTGEPLSDEEMVLMGELLGEAKPPTATAEEVEQSGLRVIKGSEVQDLVEKKEILEGSADRCLVSLSDDGDGEGLMIGMPFRFRG
jgi:hypothetical protein